jgi:hypothetical protein
MVPTETSSSSNASSLLDHDPSHNRRKPHRGTKTKASVSKTDYTSHQHDHEDDPINDDAPVCFICTESIIVGAFGPCGHLTCDLCMLRLRALYKTKTCAYCKVLMTRTCVMGVE